MQSLVINKEDNSNKELMQSQVTNKEDNSNKDLMQSPIINEEDNSIKELMHTLVITEEKIQNLKTDVIAALEEIRMEPGNGIYIEVPVEALVNLEYTTMCTLEELEKLQKKDMLLRQQLDQSDNHEEQEQKIQLEDKEQEINKLKIEVVDLTKEMNELNVEIWVPWKVVPLCL
jgi:hypothetical protein